MRCFIAAWPDDATRQRLQQLIDALVPRVPKARPMQPRNLHLTLAFIGTLDDAAAARVASASGDLLEDAFEWSIDALGWFARARVAWAGGASNAQLDTAAARARARLDQLAVRYDRKTFVPHVTLFRDTRRFDCSGPLSPPLAWRTETVALYTAARDVAGPIYRKVEPARATAD